MPWESGVIRRSGDAERLSSMRGEWHLRWPCASSVVRAPGWRSGCDVTFSGRGSVGAALASPHPQTPARQDLQAHCGPVAAMREEFEQRRSGRVRFAGIGAEVSASAKRSRWREVSSALRSVSSFRSMRRCWHRYSRFLAEDCDPGNVHDVLSVVAQ